MEWFVAATIGTALICFVMVLFTRKRVAKYELESRRRLEEMAQQAHQKETELREREQRIAMREGQIFPQAEPLCHEIDEAIKGIIDFVKRTPPEEKLYNLACVVHDRIRKIEKIVLTPHVQLPTGTEGSRDLVKECEDNVGPNPHQVQGA